MKNSDYIDHWTKVNLSTNRPNRDRLKQCLDELYDLEGFKPPDLTIVKSPKALVAEVRRRGGTGRISFGGFFEAYWLMRFTYGVNEEQKGTAHERAKLKIATAIADEIAYLYMDDEYAVACEKPTHIHLDAGNRKHCETGPSIGYADGVGAYHLHDTKVTKQIIMAPETLSMNQINDTKNAEIKRIMIERYGMDKYLIASGAAPLDTCLDQFGREVALFKLPASIFPIVRVVNASLEPDGTRKVYVLTATKDTSSAREAVASLAGTDTKYYQPMLES